ncbi:MAG TPA: hypothetical protein VF221_00210 [Chloroflexota bacterium]
MQGNGAFSSRPLGPRRAIAWLPHGVLVLAALALVIPSFFSSRAVTAARAEGFDTLSSCPESVVIYGMNGLDSSVALGATGELNLVDSSIDPCLDTKLAATGHTARIHLAGNNNDWVEVGWMEKNASGRCTNYTSTNHCFSLFTEWGKNGTRQNQVNFNPAPGPGNCWPATGDGQPQVCYVPAACVTVGRWQFADVEVVDPLHLNGSWTLYTDCEGRRRIPDAVDLQYNWARWGPRSGGF